LVDISSQKPSLQTGNIEQAYNDHNLKNSRLNIFFNANVFWAIPKKCIFLSCLWVVFWQARMPKMYLAGAVIPE
jgi:hypothetical protein